MGAWCGSSVWEFGVGVRCVCSVLEFDEGSVWVFGVGVRCECSV